jgi:hypothetical protein
MAHPAHLQLPQLVFDELIGRAGQRLSTQVDEAPKIIQNPQKIVFFFFKSGAQVSSHFFCFFLRSIWALRKNKQQEGEEKKEEDIFSSFKMLCVA